MLGKVVHYTIDALLISTTLAAIKRCSGIQPVAPKDKEWGGYVQKYLSVGEWLLDTSILIMNNSAYFEKK
ncbi:uncharacterized protein BYT42DRAFT_556460 [Radiomyces spectabilis]|uniref:uncharacterized protein n=1 Tax=Radiomyces spectabilis TaxID=64574 RepID=UPI0022201104|nr:uncharacterized protein BYT42DRAFT_556460 [Radiomyces spectabilis]KAI8391312.1 hypothetical protein BYT42DRAFT_556460 [Radiomyces spectabilis]